MYWPEDDLSYVETVVLCDEIEISYVWADIDLIFVTDIVDHTPSSLWLTWHTFSTYSSIQLDDMQLARSKSSTKVWPPSFFFFVSRARS